MADQRVSLGEFEELATEAAAYANPVLRGKFEKIDAPVETQQLR
jgi:hypothetical protein